MAVISRNVLTLKRLAFAAALLSPAFAAAQDVDLLPPTVIFVTSSGFWEDDGDIALPSHDSAAGTEVTKDKQTAAQKRSGYYKLVAIRQPDRTAKIYLQQIALSGSAPEVVTSIELEELTTLKPYVSDIRPERLRAGGAQPGLFATVILRTDPKSAEPESWTVMIDELGELTIEKASN